MTTENCGVHRLSLTIIALKQRLAGESLTSEERAAIEQELFCLEAELGID